MLIEKNLRVDILGFVFMLVVIKIGENLVFVVFDWNLNENLF